MAGHSDRPDPGSSPTVGDTERLVQVEMAHVSPETTGLADPHLGIDIGSIEVNLSAVTVHHRADLTDALLKHTMGGGIGDHQRCQILTVLLRLGREI